MQTALLQVLCFVIATCCMALRPVLRMKVGDPIFCVNVNLYLKPDRRDDFIRVIKANQKGTLSTEKLAVLYTWGQSTSDPNTFYFQEQYHGKEGFDAHTKSAHFAEWEKFTETSPFTKPPEVMLFEENPPSK